MVSIWLDGQIGESIIDAEGNDVPVKSLNTLKTSWYMNGLIIRIIFVPFKLTRRMNSGSPVEQCILMRNANDRTFLSLDYSTNSANVNLSELMAIYSSNVNSASSFEDDTHVCTGHTTISTSINE
jgi:hypothetical protein